MKKRQFRVLYREFLFRIVDLELLAQQGDMTKLLGQFAALLLVTGLWVLFPVEFAATIPAPTGSGLILTWAAEYFLITTSMLVVGFVAVLSWESLFPDRRDVLVLAPLPIRGRTLFWAKVAAVATALCLTMVLLNFFPGIGAPFILATAPSAPPPRYEQAIAPVSAADMQSVLDRDLAPARIPDRGSLVPGTNAGVSIGVLKHGERQVFSYGTAKPEFLFEIGSITKTFTGLVLAKMVAQGKVRFDEPIRELLPAGTVAKPKGNEITLLDLITHHSGLPSIPENFNPADMANPYADYRAANLYAYLAKQGVAKPGGTSFDYSNLGVGLLGQGLANRAGMKYEDLVKAEVTGPLGMSDTVVTPSPEQRKRFIEGHDGRRTPVLAWDFDALAGAGGIRSTAGDMLTYLEAQLHPERLGALSAAVLESHKLRAEGPVGTSIALAWFYRPDSGTYWHNGGTAGYSSYATFSPKGDYAAVVLLNTSSGFVEQLGDHIIQRMAGLPAVSLANQISAGSGSLPNRLRSFAAYWITMLAAGAFIFCCVLSVQGVAQLLPRQQFLRVSSVLQMAFFCLLLTAYFLQPAFVSPEILASKQRWLPWFPSAWFLGLFQQFSGTLPEQFAFLARRAWIALAIAGSGAVSAYLICYFRTLRKIVEQPDITPGVRGVNWLPRFGNSLDTAVGQFSVRTLFRSRQHRVLLAFYLGIGLAITIFFMRTPAARQLAAGTATDPWHQASVPLLASSVLIMAAWVVGIRMVFSMPLDLRANWIFRVTPIGGGRECLVARRRALRALSLIPFLAGSAVLFFSIWPWRAAAGHLLVLGLVGITVTELCMHGTQKIPFTCSYLPGKSNFHLIFWVCLALLLLLIYKAADWERSALGNPAGYATMLALLVLAAVLAHRRTAALANSDEGDLQFEEVPEPVIFTLGINSLAPRAQRSLHQP